MNLFVIALLVFVLTIQLALREQLVPSSFVYLAELFSGIATLCVAARLVSTRRLYIEKHYIFLFCGIGLIMLCSILWQSPSAGAVTMGLRHYFKFLPLLLLPAAFEFTPRQLKLQLLIVTLIFLAQAPVALYQRFIEYASEMHNGDLITGSFGSSGALGFLMAAGIAFVTCAYLRGQIRLITMMAATAIFAVPTMINETKIAIALIPLAVLLPLLFMTDRGQAFRKMVPVLGSGALALVAFVSVYDFVAEYNAYNTPMRDFLTETEVRDYLYTGRSSSAEIGYVGRADSIVLAVDRLSRDPVDFAFGLGPGNVMPSSISGFEGAYVRYNTLYGAEQTEVSRLLWEVGVSGTLAFGLLLCFLFYESLWLSRQSGFFGYLGHAWLACIALSAVGFFYAMVLGLDELTAPFWFFSGVVIAAKARLRATARDAVLTARAQPIRVATTSLRT
jgi:hypothetical protein